MSEKLVYYILATQEQNKYRQVLTEYFKYVKGIPEDKLVETADKAYDNLIHNLDLSGNEVTNPNINYFDDLLSTVTNGFYKPIDSNRFKHEKGVKVRRRKVTKEGEPIASTELSSKETDAITRIKENLLTEYPNLNRKDLQESINNYCTLMVQVNKLTNSDVVKNNIAIKNLTDTLIKLGSFLGIDETQKAKQKAMDDQQSVASLSLQFQTTLDQFPQIVKRMKYKELRILLEKYDRQELSKALFESESYAGMSVNEAREFVKTLEVEYESK